MPQHGGYRQPANPAPVSGPGALSQRTDGGPGQPVREMPDADYGEAKAFREQQQAAPMGGPVDASGIVGLGEPSQHPEQPVTQGAVDPRAPIGPDEQDALNFRNYFGLMKQLASRPNASRATKQMVRQLEAHMSEGIA